MILVLNSVVDYEKSLKIYRNVLRLIFSPGKSVLSSQVSKFNRALAIFSS